MKLSPVTLLPSMDCDMSGKSGIYGLTVIGLIAFLTLVDLFATQAILPALADAYQVTPAAMGVAVNASTFGMAIAGLLVALFSRHLNRRKWVVLSLLALSMPTFLLAFAPNLPVFALLRVLQGLCMSAAFSLTLAYLAEQSGPKEIAAALAAYVTGNVASNLFGRLMSATIADHLGLASNFYIFAGLNLLGAAIAYQALTRTQPMPAMSEAKRSATAILRGHLLNPPLLATFLLGFLILFAFIGTFTYVNFVLVKPPFSVHQMQLGLVYFVFVPSMLTTPLAGFAVARFGTRLSCFGGLAVAMSGLPLLLTSTLNLVLVGLCLVGAGTFFSQAIATGFVGRAATSDRGAAGGLYLASYFLGGLAGSFILGQLFGALGWIACVVGIGFSVAVGMMLASKMALARE
ncbi:MFS transporter [Dongia sp.]|uniref:MFS transporter n=1 Tax=Dongia sp. TaxID=1977262 RepID=UPI0035AF2C9D